MYNLIMGAVDGVLPAERLLEGVESDLDTFVRSGGDLNLARLLSLPTLSMPEIGHTRSPQVAQVGNVVSLNRAGRDYHFRFIRDESIPPIPSDRIEAARGSARHRAVRVHPNPLNGQGRRSVSGADRAQHGRHPQADGIRGAHPGRGA